MKLLMLLSTFVISGCSIFKPWKQPDLPLAPGDNTILVSRIEKGITKKKLKRLTENKIVNKSVDSSCVGSSLGFNFVGLKHYEIGFYRHLIFNPDNTSMMQMNKRASNLNVQSTKNNINQIKMNIKSVPCLMEREGKKVFVRTELYGNEQLNSVNDNLLSKDAVFDIFFSGFRYRYRPKDDYIYRYGDNKRHASTISLEEYMEEAIHMADIGQINKDKKYSCIDSEKTVNYLDIVEDYTDYFDYFFIPSNEVVTSQIREQNITEKYNSYYYESTKVSREGTRHVCYICLFRDDPRGVCRFKRRVVSVYHPSF